MASRYHFQTNARPTLGADIGSALGTGLGKGLTALAETKLNSMLSRQKRAADKQKLVSLGMADHEAEYLSHQDPDTQWQAARAWLVAGGAPDNMLPKQLGDPFNITPEQEAAAREQLGINQPQEQQQPIQGPKTAADFITQQGPMSPQIRQALEGMKLPQGQPEQGASAAMQSIAPQQSQPMAQPQMQAQQQVPRQQAIPSQQVEPQQRRPKSIGEAFRIAEGGGKGAGEAGVSDATAQKETKDYYDKVSEEARAAKNNEIRLNKLEKLINKGKLASPTWASTIKFLHLGGWGPDLGSWLSADTQEFQKLSTDFIKDAKQIFGSRMTDQDLKTFLDTIPNITQSDEAKKRVIKNMRVFNTAANARKNAMDQIIAYNGGRRPADLDVQVERNVQPLLDQLANDFKENESSNQPFVGQQLKALPDAKSYPAGAEIRDKKSGKVYRTDGNTWTEV